MTGMDSPGPLPLQSFEGEPEDLPLMLARGWAEASTRLLGESAELRRTYRALSRAYDRMDGDGISEVDLIAKIREIWITESMLVHAASNLEVWIAKLYRVRRRRVPRPIRHLKQLRNALEHLEEASFDDESGVATARTQQATRSGIGALPGAQLQVGLGGDGLLFGVISPDELHTLVGGLVADLDGELDEHVEDWIDFMNEDR
jgi:hypothetical protein